MAKIDAGSLSDRETIQVKALPATTRYWRSTMRFVSAEARDAYRRGAQDMLDHTFQRVSAVRLREVQGWLAELEGWKDGDAPDPPSRWKMT